MLWVNLYIMIDNDAYAVAYVSSIQIYLLSDHISLMWFAYFHAEAYSYVVRGYTETRDHNIREYQMQTNVEYRLYLFMKWVVLVFGFNFSFSFFFGIGFLHSWPTHGKRFSWRTLKELSRHAKCHINVLFIFLINNLCFILDILRF